MSSGLVAGVCADTSPTLSAPAAIETDQRFMSSSVRTGSSGSSLLDRREVGWIEEDRFRLVDDLAVLLGVRLGLDPLRISLERRPILFRVLATRVGEQVDDRVARERRVLRDEIADAGDVVLGEALDRVLAEARLQRLELPWRRRVGPHFEH